MDCILQPFTRLRLTMSQARSRRTWALICYGNRLGHPGSDTMRHILKSLHGHPISSKDLVYYNTICQAFSLKKLMKRPSPIKITKELIPLPADKEDICRQSNHHAYHFVILLCWLMHRHIGHMFVYCPLEILFFLNSSPRLLSWGLATWIIR